MSGLPADGLRFVYFDLDDTLLDHRRAERAALRDTHAAHPALARHDFERVHAHYHQHNSALWAAYAQGAVTRDELKRLRFARTLEALGAPTHDADAVHTHYMAGYARHWHLPDAALHAFGAIADAFPVGLLTNGFADVQRAKLERFPALARRLSALVISEEVGIMKPHRALFEWAARKAGCAASEILYVGDSLRSDVEGARGAGWQAAWYGGDEAQAPPGVLCFSEWHTLLGALGLPG